MSQHSSKGRPWERVRLQVFATETHCWVCGQYVDQTLTTPDPQSRTVDHVVPRARGGTDHRSNLRLAHRQCNSDRGVGLHNHAVGAKPPRIW